MQHIETARLILRPSTAEEFESNYRVLVEEIEGADFAREAYVPEFQFDLYLAQQNLGQQFWRPSIVLKDGGRFIGYCLLMPRLCTPDELSILAPPGASPTRFGSIEAEIGWAISERYRNAGYATEAAQALIDYGFLDLHLPRIIALTEQDNSASIRVMEKLGMRLHCNGEQNSEIGVLENVG